MMTPAWSIAPCRKIPDLERIYRAPSGATIYHLKN